MTQQFTDVKVSGPVFDPRFGEVVKITITEGILDLTKEGERRAQASAVKRTGAFAASQHGTMKDSMHGVITPDKSSRGGPYFTNALLGSWLETGKRRHEQTRFKGYHLYRRVRAQLARLANKTADTIAIKITMKSR